MTHVKPAVLFQVHGFLQQNTPFFWCFSRVCKQLSELDLDEIHGVSWKMIQKPFSKMPQPVWKTLLWKVQTFYVENCSENKDNELYGSLSASKNSNFLILFQSLCHAIVFSGYL